MYRLMLSLLCTSLIFLGVFPMMLLSSSLLCWNSNNSLSSTIRRFLIPPRRSVTTCNYHPCFNSMMLQSSSSSSFVAKRQLTSRILLKQIQRHTTSSRLFHTCRLWMMPEGPEVRTLVDQLQPAVGMQLNNIHFISGRYVTHGLPKGYTDFHPTLENNQNQQQNTIQKWSAKGKFMYIILDHGDNYKTYYGSDINGQDDWQRSIWITLGMSGRFVNEKRSAQQTTPARWYMEFSNNTKLFYFDPRNFGTLRFSLSKQELQSKLDSLGPDILWAEDMFPVELFLNIVKKQSPRMNICKFLMDQKRISGIGNYLLAEGLYKAQIDPYASLSEISDVQYQTLFQQLQITAQRSYRANGVTRSSGGTYTDVYGDKGKFVFELECYGREIASNHQPVIQDKNGPHGRTIWYTEDQLFKPLHQRLASSTQSSLESSFGPSTESNSQSSLLSARIYSSNLDINSSSKQEPKSVSTTSVAVSAVKSLSSYLTEPSWKEALSPYMSTSKDFQRIANFLAEEYDQGFTIFPPKHEIFAALNLCPFEEVKVVIMGQDPYFNPNQGHGLAFSVREGVPIPPSLRNIYKEAIEDVGIRPPTSGCLESWAKQGVLLLNTVLTVRCGEANSHAGKGWESFTDHILQLLSKDREGIIFLLWGAPAAKKAALIDTKTKNNKKNHIVIQCSHPSPLSATKTKTPFLGSRCFSRVNAALEELGEDIIDWNIP